MAEQVKVRDYFDILTELFLSKDAALEKYAKVRFTQYEMNLWRRSGLPLREVASKAKRYFGDRFLGKGLRIDEADEATLSEAFKRLGYAVGQKNEDGSFTGCHGRCLRLVNELNEALEKDGLATIHEPEKFLDYLTFDYSVRKDYAGNPVMDKPYNIEIWDFFDDIHRKRYREVIKMLKALDRKMSMQDIYRLVDFMTKRSVASK